MLHRSGLAASVLLVSCLVANGKDKKKVVLPADVLRAHTVLVMVDPQAGVDIQEPEYKQRRPARCRECPGKVGKTGPGQRCLYRRFDHHRSEGPRQDR